jgi:hypothetical protein
MQKNLTLGIDVIPLKALYAVASIAKRHHRGCEIAGDERKLPLAPVILGLSKSNPKGSPFASRAVLS